MSTPAGSAQPQPWLRVPATVWALGFVSLFMDTSSELVHSILPLFLSVTLGASMLAIGAIDTVRRYHLGRGTRHAELSWILEDNMPMRRLIEAIGGRPYKTYRIYERALT